MIAPPSKHVINRNVGKGGQGAIAPFWERQLPIGAEGRVCEQALSDTTSVDLLSGPLAGEVSPLLGNP